MAEVLLTLLDIALTVVFIAVIFLAGRLAGYRAHRRDLEAATAAMLREVDAFETFVEDQRRKAGLQ